MYFFFLLLVGGIYQVIRSKAAVTVEELGDQYYLLGPYNDVQVKTEVELLDYNTDEMCGPIIHAMRQHGIRVIILNFNHFFKNSQALK